MTSSIDIKGENAGPIKSFNFTLEHPGVWICSAPNGSGKSLLSEDLQKVAAGEGKIVVRDGETKGFIEVGGARVTFGKQTRHGGEFQIKNLEGRFSLTTLVDPGVSSPEAADKRRIATLVQIAGVVGDPALFKAHDAFADYDAVCDADVTRKDLVEMAAKVKAAYEKAARSAADEASAAKTKATTLMAPASELNMKAETDAAALQAAYDEARDALVKAESRAEEADKQKAAIADAAAKLKAVEEAYDGPTLDDAEVQFNSAMSERASINEQIHVLKQRLSVQEEKVKTTAAEFNAANEHAKVVAACTEVIKAGALLRPTDEEIEQLRQRKAARSEAQELGVKVRSAMEDLEKGKRLQAEAEELEKLSSRRRESAKATEEVLSAAIKSDRFKVAVIDAATRVVVKHARGDQTPYHELSHGEKCRLAVAEGCDRVGDGGILPLDQEFWESIDAFERPAIHDHAVEKNVFIWAPEATRDVTDGREMQVKAFQYD